MSSSILTYLSALEQNNERDWYHAHKAEYQQAAAEFEDIIGRLMVELGKTDPAILEHEPKSLTFKLNRDTRFSHDKSPYNPSFRCHISPAGKLPVPVGYFLYIQPGNRSFLGGGLFADMFKDATLRIRNHINENGEEWNRLIGAPSFADNFRVGGTALKNVPKEYDPNHVAAEYLKYKSWFIEDPFQDELLEDMPAFCDYAVKRFLMMKDFNDFLNKALEGFRMPER